MRLAVFLLLAYSFFTSVHALTYKEGFLERLKEQEVKIEAVANLPKAYERLVSLEAIFRALFRELLRTETLLYHLVVKRDPATDEVTFNPRDVNMGHSILEIGVRSLLENSAYLAQFARRMPRLTSAVVRRFDGRLKAIRFAAEFWRGIGLSVDENIDVIPRLEALLDSKTRGMPVHELGEALFEYDKDLVADEMELRRGNTDLSKRTPPPPFERGCGNPDEEKSRVIYN